jgi:prepilin-type N-terminal cleavage/methylation domain-containing protein
MNTAHTAGLHIARKRIARAQHGTTLLELMIAVALFTIISGVAFTLLNQQQNAASGLNGQMALSLGLRNASSMLQMDLANAGSNFFQAQNVSTGALGVTILNNVVSVPVSGNGCNTATTNPPTYGPSCFDQLTILTVDPNYPVMNATDNTGGTSETANCSHTYATGGGTGSTINVYGRAATLLPNTPNNTTASPVSLTPSSVISGNYFKVGDQLLFVNYTSGTYTSAILTAVPTAYGTGSTATVQFTINQTTSTGSNTWQYDPLNISSCSGNASCPTLSGQGAPAVASPPLATSFCGADWILKLAPVTYLVCAGPGSPTYPWSCNQSANSPDIADPKLMRVVGSVPSLATATVVMEQVIGFKAGGAVFNLPDQATSPSSDQTYYNYNSATYQNPGVQYPAGTLATYAYDFTLLHSVRVSLIGRTTPAPTNNYNYQNSFDNGRYQVLGTALIVNPRNMNPEVMP